MFGLQSLDVLIGLVTIYLALGLACTAVVEMIAGWTNLRSKNLEAALTEILEGNLSQPSKESPQSKAFIEAFYHHPLIQSLSRGKDGRPSYIPPNLFSTVVLSLLTHDGEKPLFDAIAALPEGRVKASLSALSAQAKGVEAQFVQNIETHFDHVMDRASGWVKSRQQCVALIVSAVLVTLGNVDTFAVANALASSPEARGQIMATAAQMTDAALLKPAPTPPTDALPAAQQKTQAADAAIKSSMALVQSSGLSLGWENWAPASGASIVSKIVGLAVSTFAVSLGAPFWFEVLQKIVKIRQAGISPNEKKKA